ncbi:MAG: hypothetical protein A2275_04105 [Bacteroidetes bacterium RIFOXYA12_FULL_35_11]|nr:MAG: hypothetical protein A2X01_10245 [Bacteroidetes bacterium GWF2_35_48]OFY81004.1 MAG: hypothetical protein A2275_04105 [Bacteroidetes bacterium RIFOXYA12_FULL_35_11]HBX49973.1 DUF2520 domain-containing protein [Bacteroidales bacterium]
MKKSINKIVMIGAGNLGTNLATAIHKSGYQIVQVFSRTSESARKLAKKTNALYTSSLDEIYPYADLYILALPDDAVLGFLKSKKLNNFFMVHTSGSLPVSVFKPFSNKFGVFYPLQTFSKNKILNFTDIPVCIEGNDKRTESDLMKIAKNISRNVMVLSSEKRKQAHLAAVFACNFTNHMYTIADEILSRKNISFDLIRPLIQETSEKVKLMKPALAQTGPALRKDKQILSAHMKMLAKDENYKKIYSFVSKSILSKTK